MICALSVWVFALLLGACGATSPSPKQLQRKAETDFRKLAAESAALPTQVIAEESPDVGRMLTEAKLLLAREQYEPALDLLHGVLVTAEMGECTSEQQAEASALLGQAAFGVDDLATAAKALNEVVASQRPEMQVHWGAAAARLVDVFVVSNRREQLPALLEQIERLARSQPSNELTYARAKALLALGRYQEAVAQARGVTGDSLLALRAAYLRGVGEMKISQSGARKDVYAAALVEFESAASADESGLGPEGQAVRELARLAVARLNYEAGLLSEAAESYRQIPADSPRSARALFELGWTHVRTGDYRRAERALGSAAAMSPALLDAAEASLLQADLLLRSGRYREAQKAYEKTRERYAPLVRNLDAFLANHPAAASYYDTLLSGGSEAQSSLSRAVIDGARELAKERRSFAVVDEVASARRLLARSRRITALSLSALSTGAGVKAFPLNSEQQKQLVRLQNELALVRLTLARGLDAAAGSTSGELTEVRRKRRELMASIAALPATPAAFTAEDSVRRKDFDEALSALQQAQLTADQMQALANGLTQVLQDASSGVVRLSAASRRQYESELAATRQELTATAREIDALRREVERGRQQVGFGGQQTADARALRAAFSDLQTRELTLSASGQDHKSAARNYSAKALGLNEELELKEAQLDAAVSHLSAQLEGMQQELGRKIQEQAAGLPEQAALLDELEREARELVAQAARQSFLDVRTRLADVLLRADLGLVQKSWERREEQRRRVRRLQRERAREQRTIDDELAEVIDDKAGPQ